MTTPPQYLGDIELIKITEDTLQGQDEGYEVADLAAELLKRYKTILSAVGNFLSIVRTGEEGKGSL